MAAANENSKEVTPDELRRVSNELTGKSKGNAEKMSEAIAYQGRVLAQIHESMVTRSECEQRCVKKWNWKAIAALAPVGIAFFAFVLKITGII